VEGRSLLHPNKHIKEKRCNHSSQALVLGISKGPVM